jgi:hypothetical protein
MELTRAELIFAATMLHAAAIAGFEHLFPAGADEKRSLWETGRTRLEASGILQQEEGVYRLDPAWLYRIALAADPESALIIRRTTDRGVQTVGVYFGDGVAVELVQRHAGQIQIRDLPSMDVALARITAAVQAAPETVRITPYHPAADGALSPQPEWRPSHDLSAQNVAALLP